MFFLSALLCSGQIFAQQSHITWTVSVSDVNSIASTGTSLSDTSSTGTSSSGTSLSATSSSATSSDADASKASLSGSAESSVVSDSSFELSFHGKIAPGMHSYPLTSAHNAPEIDFSAMEGCEKVGGLRDLSATHKLKDDDVVEGELLLVQTMRLTSGKSGSQSAASVKGTVRAMVCDNANNCFPPEYYDFEVSVPVHSSADAASGSHSESLWSLILSAILWGFAMLLTPCVFPMIPMTVSFFLKSSSKPSRGRFMAFMYGLFIVLLYTVPISLIIFITWIFGGSGVTADIFNWLATHWLPNLLFFVIFMLFAASFFGAFEINMPSSIINKADSKSDKGGLVGVFFMALTLVLVSFSCTGPIVGTVLIQSTQGQFWTPMVTMLAFSVAFALPFTIFAMFPSLMGKLKSGSWLNSVKVVLGFVELSLGLKFLSVADQTYHWGILDREVYIALWITIFSLLGFYLLGKIRFKNDEPVEKIGIVRLSLSILVFSFVVYMVPGMFGAPLKALSGYLPPITTQDFVLSANASTVADSYDADADVADGMVKLPYGLTAYPSIEQGLEAAAVSGKPVFVDISGHGCVNCREMEARVWSDPRVQSLLSHRFEIVALYLDDKTKLPENEWFTDENGRVYKDKGRVNSYIALSRFNVNAQPNYVLLSPDGKQLAPPRGYNLNVDDYVDFLNIALK